MAGITLYALFTSKFSSLPFAQSQCRGPLLYSYVVQNLSWQMGFWFVIIPLGMSIFFVFFFVPEVCVPLLHLRKATHYTLPQ